MTNQMFFRKKFYFKNCNKIFYLPIEIYDREFRSKLYLAYKASLEGWTVVLGPKYDVDKLAEYLPRGVYLGIGFHKSSAKISEILKRKRHIIFLQDEEGLVRLKNIFYKQYRVYSNIIKFADYILCWGKNHKNVMRSALNKFTNIKSIGNSRIDILQSFTKIFFSKNIKDIKNKHGDFVLINGNFGSANHAMGQEYLLNELESRGWFNNPMKKEYQLKRIEFQKKILNKMLDMSIAIAKTGTKVIVRPHPSENIEFWKKYTKNFKNIKIIRSGNAIDWMVSAKLIIHNGCTTAVEGLLLGKTIISYRPYKDGKVESLLPNAISNCLKTEKDVITFIKNFKENKNKKYKLNQAKKKYIDNHIQNFKSGKDSSDKIIDIMNKFSFKNETSQFDLIKGNIILEMNLFKLKLARKIYKKNFLYLKSKCPKMDLKNVNEILNSLQNRKTGGKKFKTFKLTNYSIVIDKA
tara:strand:- start:332 stop:1723 length:1392 start_codon:yes stop_codon:yes gene_type:complete